MLSHARRWRHASLCVWAPAFSVLTKQAMHTSSSIWAFGRTKHFALGGIKRYAERLGTRYGIGLNAMTGHDRTVYMISLPTDEPYVLDSTALILSDWLTGLQLDSLEVEQERSIIKEEIRAYVQTDPFYALKVGTGIHSRSLP